MEYEHKIKAQIIRDAQNRQTKSFPSDIKGDMRISLQWRIINDRVNICFGLKCDVPSHYKQVDLGYDVSIIKHRDDDDEPSNERYRVASISTHHYDDGRNYGSGPFGFDYGHMDVDRLVGAGSQFVDENDEVTFVYTINRFVSRLEPDVLIKKMYEKMFPDEVQSELDGLRQENLKMTAQLERLRAENEQHKKDKIVASKEHAERSAESSSRISHLEKENRIMRETTSALRSQMMNLKTEMEKLEDTLVTKEFDKVMEMFDPEKVNLERTLEDLRNIQKKILRLQIRLAERIMKEERCGVCQKNQRTYAFRPCGHLYFCKECQGKKKIKTCPIPECKQDVTSTVKVAY